ncbi:MAG: methylated-DNA--[protein]-cysteine S-methyltransferase [Candidatus Eisenbacteria bacterium]
MRIAYHVISAPAPLGLLFVAATEHGLRYVEFMDKRSLKRTIAAHAAENPGAVWEHSVRDMRPLAEQLDQWFSGAARHLAPPLDFVGSEFQRKVWNALLEIPYGETRTYGDIAKAIGEPKAARAVGLAANQNPVMIFVPCHRVIGADGKLVGYAGGLPRKKFLLALEARFRDMLPLEADRVIAAATVKAPAAPRTRTPQAAPKSGAKPARPRVKSPRANAPSSRTATRRGTPVAARPAGATARTLAAAPAKGRTRRAD